MEIAALTKRILIQKNTIRTDKFGNHSAVWSDYFRCYATISSGKGKETEDAGTVNTTEKYSFTVRYCSELSNIDPTQYRILCDGRIFDITFVDQMGFKKKGLKFQAEFRKR